MNSRPAWSTRAKGSKATEKHSLKKKERKKNKTITKRLLYKPRGVAHVFDARTQEAEIWEVCGSLLSSRPVWSTE